MKHITDIEVQQYLDGTLADSERIGKHISVCEKCRREVELYTSLYSGLSEEIEEGLSVDFADSVINSLPDEESSGMKWFSAEWLLIPGSIAASIAVVFYYFGTGWLMNILNRLSVPDVAILNNSVLDSMFATLQNSGGANYFILGIGVMLLLAFLDKLIVKFRLTDFFNRRFSML